MSSENNNQILVWDLFVRVFHWSLVACVTVAWVTQDPAGVVHHASGYVAIGLVLLRLIWGFLGTRYARFSQFVRRPATVWRYLDAITKGEEARYIGHNPAGGAMVVALLVMVAATAASGYALTTDRFWGIAWIGDLHSALATGLLILIGLHVAGVLLASFRHHENLIGAMVSGYKRSARPND